MVVCSACVEVGGSGGVRVSVCVWVGECECGRECVDVTAVSVW